MIKKLTEGKPAKLILYFTLPLIGGNIFQQLYSFIDTLLVGRFLGVEALAAVGCTGCLMFLLVGYMIGLSSGLSIYTGQRFGARDYTGVHKSAAACLMLALVIGVIMAVLGVHFARDILVIMDTPPDILDGADSFISIILGGIPITAVFMLETNLLRALGDSRRPTIILAMALCINIIIEPIFLLVFDWGIPGAAYGVLVSQFLGAVIVFAYIWNKVPLLVIRRKDWDFDWTFVKNHLMIALPMAFQTSIIALGTVVVQIALNRLGPIPVAAYAAAQKIETIALMPMMSFGIAMAAYTAQNYGAGKFARIKKGVNQCIIMSGSFSLAVGIFNVIFGSSIMELFVGDSAPEVVELGQVYIVTTSACYFVLALLFIYRNTLQGLGQSFVPSFAGVMELVMRTVVALCFVDTLGFWGATIASPAAWFGSCIPLAIAYYYTLRRLKVNIREIKNN
ncbi:MAG: MATE family efflux transporter [Anaerovibrio sp.]|uniref:MATE family efflux transporter n=1 Tax=Anaerovibrio sp. TaxID=1872532 RepID=UPI0025E66D2A|nr:MATE family efflux transporter [Anaerovibrio sp.]MCR5176541.1 MATE family efflux transporter [Anaerovibrio sp.]